MIHPKVFRAIEMVRRHIFRGRPYYFNAADLNKQMMCLQSFQEELSKASGMASNIQVTFNQASEDYVDYQRRYNRSVAITWGECDILYNGVKYHLASGSHTGFVHIYTEPEAVTDTYEKPSTYIVLTAELATVVFADNPTLCGVVSDEHPTAVPSVDVEQYMNVRLRLTADPSTEPNCIGIIGALKPLNNQFKKSSTQYGYIKFYIPFGTSFLRFLMENVYAKLSNIVNLRQLSAKYNLADLTDAAKARANIGLSNIINHRQLVRSENLRDLADTQEARTNLGLGNSSTCNIGPTSNDVAPGNILPVGFIGMWSGDPAKLPSGWYLCDGTNNTPDLSGRFIVGIGKASTGIETHKINTYGGSGSIQLTEGNIPPHSHRIPLRTTPGGSGDGGRNCLHGDWVNNGGGETSSSVSIKTAASDKDKDMGHTGASLKHLPPYYALAFIMYGGIPSSEQPKASTPVTKEPLDDTVFSTPSADTDGGFTSTTQQPIAEPYGDLGVGVKNIN